MTATVTLHFQSTGSIPGKGDPIPMNGPSVTLGRGNENDVVLPDPDRMLSKRHCAIEDHNGNVVVLDFSTNGTFLNYGKLPLGNSPTPLNDGDILSLGSYEIMVSIGVGKSTADILAAPAPEIPVTQGNAAAAPNFDDLLDGPMDGPGGDFLDDLLGDDPKGPGQVKREELGEDGLLPPLGEPDDIAPPAADPNAGQGASAFAHNPATTDHFTPPPSTSSAIPDDWDDLLEPLGDPADPFAAPAPEPVSPTPQAFDVAQPVGAAAPGSDDAASRAFLRALGAEDVKIEATDLTPTLARMGKVMRTMIEGMREILMTRTAIKSEFRIEQTMIQAGGNNPLKFSISVDQAIEAMVKPKAKGYLDATDATAQALQDIKAHEVAMITGMEAALKGVLQKLDPSVLEDKIKVQGGLGSVLKSKKARYWEVYETMYAEISDQAENDFQELFAREFARAYQEQLEKLK